MRQDFGGGLGAFLFEPNTAATHQAVRARIAAALARLEPRVAVESVEVAASPDDPRAPRSRPSATASWPQARERVSLALTLAG